MKYPVITVTTYFPGKSSFISHKALRGSDYNPHFSGRESEAQSCQKKLVSKSDNSSEEEQNTNKLRYHISSPNQHSFYLPITDSRKILIPQTCCKDAVI